MCKHKHSLISLDLGLCLITNHFQGTCTGYQKYSFFLFYVITGIASFLYIFIKLIIHLPAPPRPQPLFFPLSRQQYQCYY